MRDAAPSWFTSAATSSVDDLEQEVFPPDIEAVVVCAHATVLALRSRSQRMLTAALNELKTAVDHMVYMQGVRHDLECDEDLLEC